jgi:hypothetical protein
VARFQLGTDGYFYRDGVRFVPFGANYWPASCGVRMWREWPADEIQADLDTLGNLGFNCLRFFLLWPDLEPRAGDFDHTALERLRAFMNWCADRDLAVIPTLFVGFMSGGHFFPEGKHGNLFSNEGMLERCVDFTRRVCAVMKPYAAQVLALDHGNELSAVPDSAQASPAALATWSQAISDAGRQMLGDVVVMSGQDQNQVASELGGWRFDNQPGCTCFSMHGYPVSNWWPVSADGLGDPLTRALLPLAVAIARAHGPVMLQEFGTIASACPDTQRGYLEQVLPACWRAGANGFLWWCLRDVTATVHPYEKCGMEGRLGLVDAERRPKPVTELLLAWKSRLEALPPAPTQLAYLYWPRHVHQAHDPHNPGNRADRQFRNLATMATGLRLAGRDLQVCRGDSALPEPPATVLCCGSSLTCGELRALRAWVERGGRLIWQGLDFMTLGADAEALLGAGLGDLRSPAAGHLEIFGRSWPLQAYLREVCPELRPCGAEVLARDDRGLPQVLRHEIGQGRVIAVVADMGEQFAREPARRDERGHWGVWSAWLLKLAEGGQ